MAKKLFDLKDFHSGDTEDQYIKIFASRWLVRVLENKAIINDSLFSMAGWLLGDMSKCAIRLRNDLILPNDKSRTTLSAKKDIKELLEASPMRLDDVLENLYLDNEILQNQIRKLLIGYFTEIADLKLPSKPHPVIKKLSTVFDLDKEALEICLLVFAIRQYRVIEHYIDDSLEIFRYSNRALFATMLAISVSDLYKINDQLHKLGILDTDFHSYRFTDNIESIILSHNDKNLFSFFCKPVAKTDVQLEQFNISEESKNHVLKLFANKNSLPKHVLLYGVPGSGKTSFASCIAQKLGVKIWAVQCNSEHDTQDRRTSLAVCLKVASRHKNSIILVDEAERILDTYNTNLLQGSSKGWINDLLERKNTRIIWITNEVSHLDEAVRRRFSYSINFKKLGKNESLIMWNNVLKKVNMTKYLSPKDIDHLATAYRIPVATMEMALKQAKLVAGSKEFFACVERIIKAQVVLNHNGFTPQNEINFSKYYNPLAICTAKPVPDFIKNAKKLVEKMKKDPFPGLGCILFYGPPGTGKTALARYLAQTLELELIVKKANDLLDPFVGGTEQHIAEAFEEASQTNSLLLIDEVDSFLFGREMANRSWEQSMVNQFLSTLESYQGLCICTTNFRSHLDSASMRRFPLKLEFVYARKEQLKELYKSQLMPLVGCEPAQDEMDLLLRQKYLTPGDFTAVRLKTWLDEKITHNGLIQALIEEQRCKLEGTAKNLGF